jgi:hypothetical protein
VHVLRYFLCTGSLNFPPEYPLAPPAFRMLTPSGRFEVNTRLCLSMSDYHPESWNPSWSVETLLVGLQSFMHEEANAIGSIRASDEERQRLALASRAHNAKHAIYRDLFAGGAAAPVAAAPEEPSASVCRFCFSSDGELMAPCSCKGSNEWLHVACLREWQRQVVLTQPTHPKYTTNIDTVCNVCLEPFTGAGIPKSRHEQILEFLGGAEIAEMVEPGNLLVSTREGSRENLELMAAHPEIVKQLTTWTKAVFLMLSSTKGDKGGMIAVSCSQPLASPPPDARLSAAAVRRWVALTTTPAPEFPHVLVRHWDGGPLERGDPLAVVHLPGAAATMLPRGVRRAPPHWVWGPWDEVVPVVETAARASGEATIAVNVVWGYAGWGGTQILAEIGRGGYVVVLNCVQLSNCFVLQCQ